MMGVQACIMTPDGIRESKCMTGSVCWQFMNLKKKKKIKNKKEEEEEEKKERKKENKGYAWERLAGASGRLTGEIIGLQFIWAFFVNSMTDGSLLCKHTLQVFLRGRECKGY